MAGSNHFRILLVGGDGAYSGVPVYMRQLIRALEGQAQITIAADRNRGGYNFVDGRNATLIEIPGLRSSINPLRALRAARRLRRLIKENEVDFVWAHARMAVLITRLLALGRTMPAVGITLHGVPFGPGHRPGVAAVSVILEALFVRLSTPMHYVFLSQSAHDAYCRRVGPRAMARHQRHVVENCSDLSPIERTDAPRPWRRLLMTGRASHQKNYDFAADIMAHLPPDYHLTICGNDTDSDPFRQIFEDRLGPEACNKRVSFQGPLSDIRPVMEQSDLFVLTSHYEGMPIGTLEAMQAGMPVALAHIDGTAEILARHPLCVGFDLGDAEQAAAAIETLAARAAAHPNPASHIRKTWAQWFSFDAWRDRICALVNQFKDPAK